MVSERLKIALSSELRNTLTQSDEFLESFEKTLKVGVETGTSAGQLYRKLVERGLWRPNKSSKSLERESEFAAKAEYVATALESWSGVERMDKAKTVKEQWAWDDLSPRHSKMPIIEVDGTVFEGQKFEQGVKLHEDLFVIEEVENILSADRNVAIAKLHLLDKKGGLMIDLADLMPPGYHFTPSDLNVTRIEFVEHVEEGRPVVQYKKVPNDLEKYSGAKYSHGEFKTLASPTGETGRVQYGDFTDHGGMLSLLHEIAHAWQQQFHQGQGRAEFEELISDVEPILQLLAQSPEESGLDSHAHSSRNESLIEILKSKGVEVDPLRLNEPVTKKPEEHIIKLADQQFVVRSEKLKEILENYVHEERDAWAHATKVLRFLRRNGFDLLEPGLTTLSDFQKVFNRRALETYQSDLESKMVPAETVHPFTQRKAHQDQG